MSNHYKFKSKFWSHSIVLLALGAALGITVGIVSSSMIKEWKEITPDQKRLQDAVKEVGLYAVSHKRKRKEGL